MGAVRTFFVRFPSPLALLFLGVARSRVRSIVVSEGCLRKRVSADTTFSPLLRRRGENGNWIKPITSLNFKKERETHEHSLGNDSESVLAAGSPGAHHVLDLWD